MQHNTISIKTLRMTFDIMTICNIKLSKVLYAEEIMNVNIVNCAGNINLTKDLKFFFQNVIPECI
jgi:hypothetical protein